MIKIDILSKVVVHVYILISNGGMFLLLPHPWQHELSLVSLILAILTAIRWHVNAALICTFLMAKNVDHFFKCFLAIKDSSVEKLLLVLYPIFN